MAYKCKKCLSCLTKVYMDGEIYFYCSLCLDVYILRPGNNLELLSDVNILKLVQEKTGKGLV